MALKKAETCSNQKLRTIVSLMFEDIPYSEEVGAAQTKIESALLAEYETLKTDRHEDEALEELLGKYGRLSQMAELAGYPADAAKRWRMGGEAVDLRSLKREFRKQRIRVYLISALCVFALLQIMWAAYNLLSFRVLSAIANGCFVAVGLLLAVFPYRRYRKTEREASEKKYDTDAYRYLRARSDQYAKRLLNGIVLYCAVVFLFFFSELCFFLFGNSKSAEFAENILENGIVTDIPLFLILKNALLCHIFQKRIRLPEPTSYRKHIVGVAVFSASYWLAVTVLTVLVSGSISYPGNLFFVAGVIYLALVLLYDLAIRKRVMFRNLVVNRRRIAVCMAILVAAFGFSVMQHDFWYTQSYINSVPLVAHNTHNIAYDDETGVYTITSSTEDFKILHLTDIHIGGSLYSYTKDLKALRACYAEIAYTHPDLVIVTGDMSFPLGIMSFSLNNTAPVGQFAAFMRNTGIPWAFTYGNHDTETLASASKQELNDVFQSLSFKTSGNLLYPYTQPEITGRNNQLIELRNSDGSLNTGLFLIDSNAYTGEGLNAYDYIHDDQVDWYAGEVMRMREEAGHTVNSLCFIHIPLQEYRTATELYLSGSDEVKYFFGENPGDHGGITNDRVCCSEYPSKLFDTAVELGSTTGFFCGHDHYNNASLEYRGIRLTYGMSIDYLAMPGIDRETAQRGGELITIHSDGSWDLEQIPLDSIS